MIIIVPPVDYDLVVRTSRRSGKTDERGEWNTNIGEMKYFAKSLIKTSGAKIADIVRVLNGIRNERRRRRHSRLALCVRASVVK